MKKSFVVLVSWLAVSACGNAPTVPVPQCVPGMSAECTCTSGAKGAQVCDSSGAFDPCVCAGGSGGGSAGGSAGGVAGGTGGVGGGSAGGRAGGSGGGAHAGGAGGSSGGGTAGGGTVIGPDGGCAVIDPEFCDGRDNDCNGLVDDKEVCADPAVTNASPFTAGVYFLGTTAEGSCGADALQRFWPTQALGYSAGFDCYDDWFIFRPSDQTIFYSATFSGIHRNIDGGVDPVQPTPPCNDSVRQVFGFDGTGTLHYQCSDTVRRGNGDLVAQQVQSLVGVFTDGRVLVTRAATGSSGSDYVVLSSAGVELSRSSLGSSFSGSLTVDPTGVTFAGNTAYVTFKRDYGQGLHEVVVYRVDASSQWARVRRAPVEGYGYWRLALSDGTVFVRENDPLTTFDQQIKAYLPDGGVSLAWREANASTVRAHIGDQLLVGPP